MRGRVYTLGVPADGTRIAAVYAPAKGQEPTDGAGRQRAGNVIGGGGPTTTAQDRPAERGTPTNATHAPARRAPSRVGSGRGGPDENACPKIPPPTVPRAGPALLGGGRRVRDRVRVCVGGGSRGVLGKRFFTKKSPSTLKNERNLWPPPTMGTRVQAEIYRGRIRRRRNAVIERV